MIQIRDNFDKTLRRHWDNFERHSLGQILVNFRTTLGPPGDYLVTIGEEVSLLCGQKMSVFINSLHKIPGAYVCIKCKLLKVGLHCQRGC